MEFEYYLDAWHFCNENEIPFDRIVKQSFRVWCVLIED